jgi:hypothetical protein
MQLSWQGQQRQQHMQLVLACAVKGLRTVNGLVACTKSYVLTFMLLCCLLQHLQSKAEQRNPDEFYFAMEKAQTKDGVHIQRYAESSGVHLQHI